VAAAVVAAAGTAAVVAVLAWGPRAGETFPTRPIGGVSVDGFISWLRGAVRLTHLAGAARAGPPSRPPPRGRACQTASPSAAAVVAVLACASRAGQTLPPRHVSGVSCKEFTPACVVPIPVTNLAGCLLPMPLSWRPPLDR